MARNTVHRPDARTHPRGDGRPRRNIFTDRFSDEELRRILDRLGDSPDLGPTIEATHVILDRILARLTDSADPEIWLATVRAWSDTAGRLAQLMRTQRVISGDAADSLADHIAAALDEVAAALGAEL